MYKIFADDTLIYDSTLEDYKIGKGLVTKETDKSGSFVFSLYPDHFFYDRIVKMRTIVKVYKSDKIVFRGRVLDDSVDHWNNKVQTCEGELGFLRDSVVRPFTFSGTAATLFTQLIQTHNSQVDENKRFSIGEITVEGSVNIVSEEYPSTLDSIAEHLLEQTGGHLHIHHDGDTPVISYLADFTETSSQTIEFGENLKNYMKKTNAAEIVTAVIPLGTIDGNEDVIDIKGVNGGKDYVYSEEGVALYGWIFKKVDFDGVSSSSGLLAKAQEYVENASRQNITLELSAVDLHLLDRSIESFRCCQYVPVISEPHGINMTMLCNKQTLDLLRPDNDTVTLGYTYSTFTESSTKAVSRVSKVTASLRVMEESIVGIVEDVEGNGTKIEQTLEAITLEARARNEADAELESMIQQQADSITLQVMENVDDEYYAKQSSVAITANGIDISSTGSINLESGASFTVDAGNFKVTENGILTATGANATNLNVYSSLFFRDSSGNIVATINFTDGHPYFRVGSTSILDGVSGLHFNAFDKFRVWQLSDGTAQLTLNGTSITSFDDISGGESTAVFG